MLAYRNRYYKPDWGRFISEDPIGLGGGINVYVYVHDNPISLEDPYGLDPTGGSGPQDLLQLIELIAETEIEGLGPEDPIADAAVVGEIIAYEEGAFASSSLYDTSITRASSQYLNVQTSVGAAEFQQNLVSSGYNVVNQSQSATRLSNGTNIWTIYTRTSTGAPGAQFFGGNGSVVTYSLGGP